MTEMPVDNPFTKPFLIGYGGPCTASRASRRTLCRAKACP